MTFTKNTKQIAHKAMREISPELAEKFASLMHFLSLHPDSASALRGKSAPPIGTEDYIRQQAIAFSKARNPRAPKPSATVPDEMVSVILVSYFGIETENVDRIKREHLLSMNAENMVGDILERYLASILEPEGRIWCSGAVVKAVDFIKPESAEHGWRLLQVKNRDNSENSSSSAIRAGTNIEKWFRSFSRTGKLNWEAFHDVTLKTKISEDGFKDFVRSYLQQLTPQPK
jgi:hypothetical protein